MMRRWFARATLRGHASRNAHGIRAVAVATLLVIQGIDEGTRFELADDTSGIGRGVRNRVRIIDSEVSRQHAVIEFRDGRYHVVDRGSSNGTYVNGRTVRRHELHTGDRIQVGRTVLVFSDRRESPAAAGQMIDMIGGRDAVDESRIVSQMEDSVDGPLFEQTALVTGDQNRVIGNLNLLYRISEEIARPTLSTTEMLQRVLRLTIDAIGADRGCILLKFGEDQPLLPQAYLRRHDSGDTSRMPVSQTIVDYVIRHGQGVRTSDARTDNRFEQGQSILQAGIGEALCVPLHSHSELLGVIYVDTTTPSQELFEASPAVPRFGEDHLRLLLAIGRQTALAVESSRYQKALVKAERLAAMGQTIAMLSHHIKNILQGVRGGSYLIDMGLKNSNEELVRKGWGIVEGNQDKIYQLVMDMLTFSTERQPALKKTQLNEVVGEVCELMQARAEECGVRVTVELGSEIPETNFDPEGIHRAVLNIVTNAIDAVESSDDGAVLVQTGFDADSDLLFVVVADNGPGIPEEQLPELFNVFQSTKGARGTGLGLAVSKKILREHGGEISVESELGAGCRFTLGWPACDDEHRPMDSGTQHAT